MSLYPGAPRTNDEGRRVLDDTALAQSMALAIEEEMEEMFQQVKEKPMPDDSKPDLRLLFVSISRGILRYLNDHQVVIRARVIDGPETLTADEFDLGVTMDSHTPH